MSLAYAVEYAYLPPPTMKVQTGSGSGGYINHLPTTPLVTPHHHVATAGAASAAAGRPPRPAICMGACACIAPLIKVCIRIGRILPVQYSMSTVSC